MKHIRTVLGPISPEQWGKCLAHEHICCYFEYFDKMLGSEYLDREKLALQAAAHLRQMKAQFGLTGFIDCTPVNIGRDMELLRRVSRESGVAIVSSTGFYYTEEIMLRGISGEHIAEAVLRDIARTGAGLIKFAVDAPAMSQLSLKLLDALCAVQLHTGLPLCIHTNAGNRNGQEVLDHVLSRGVSPRSLTIGHLSDTADMDYVSQIASSGCYVAFDRIYKTGDPAYYDKKAQDILTLCERGYADQILLSHDGLVFNAFNDNAPIRQDNPFTVVFERLLPAIGRAGVTDAVKLVTDNPRNMLLCAE